MTLSFDPLVSSALWLTLVFLLVLFLRHDYWNWSEPRPLLFGFLPVGLWWQGVVSIFAAVMMALMVKFAWPAHLEEQTEVGSQEPEVRNQKTG